MPFFFHQVWTARFGMFQRLSPLSFNFFGNPGIYTSWSLSHSLLFFKIAVPGAEKEKDATTPREPLMHWFHRIQSSLFVFLQNVLGLCFIL
jgi:hypothetical protein